MTRTSRQTPRIRHACVVDLTRDSLALASSMRGTDLIADRLFILAKQHVGMSQVRWIKHTASPDHEVVVNGLRGGTAVVINVGRKGTAAAHIVPSPTWIWRSKVHDALQRAKEHWAAGDRVVVHMCQADSNLLSRSLRGYLQEGVFKELSKDEAEGGKGRPLAPIHVHTYYAAGKGAGPKW